MWGFGTIGLPPSEIAVHPAEKSDRYEFYLLCDDVTVFTAKMKEHGLACSAVEDRGWGLVTRLTLPGGGNLGVYQPRHARPEAMSG